MDQILEFIFSHKREFFELTKIAIGSFLGFGLALLSARLLDYRKRKRERLVAGNVALFTLKNQYNDFLLFRRDFRENVARPGLSGNAPIWALLQPTFLQIDDSKIDFNSIGFLFEEGKNASRIDILQNSQIAHRDLLSLHVKRNESLIKLQEAAVRVSKTPSGHTLEDVEKEAGPALISLVTLLTVSLANRASKYEQTYRDAYDSLWLALTHDRQSWRDRMLGFVRGEELCAQCSSPYLKLDVARPGYKIEDLPPLPDSLTISLADGKISTWGAKK